jgi:hypothetical protein
MAAFARSAKSRRGKDGVVLKREECRASGTGARRVKVGD